MIKIEKLKLENLAEFLLVFKEILTTGFPEYSAALVDFLIGKDYSATVFEEKLKNNQWFVLKASLENQLVGFLLADNLYGGVSYCNWVGVLEKCQGQGIGQALLGAWEEEIKKVGGHKLTLITQSRKNMDFYLKAGFKQEGFEEKSWFGLDCWLYGKVIGDPKPEIFLK